MAILAKAIRYPLRARAYVPVKGARPADQGHEDQPADQGVFHVVVEENPILSISQVSCAVDVGPDQSLVVFGTDCVLQIELQQQPKQRPNAGPREAAIC